MIARNRADRHQARPGGRIRRPAPPRPLRSISSAPRAAGAGQPAALGREAVALPAVPDLGDGGEPHQGFLRHRRLAGVAQARRRIPSPGLRGRARPRDVQGLRSPFGAHHHARDPLAARDDAACGAGRAAAAEQFPSKPITLVVPYAPGGNVDISTRILQAAIGNSLGQPIIIENRPGAGGTIAGEYVARSAPDGHTLFVGSNGPIMFGPMTMPKPPYQWDKVFAPVSTLAFATNMLLVRPTLPVKTVAELIDYSKKNPGKLTLATSGGVSINHFLAELLKLKTGITWTEVHYRGNAPAIADLMAGHVDVGFQQLTDSRAARRGRQAPRAGGARAEARRRRCPMCRPASRPAFPRCRASPSTASSRRRARRRPSIESSAPRSAPRWRRRRSSTSSPSSAPKRAAARRRSSAKFLARRNREVDRRHAEGQHQGAK